MKFTALFESDKLIDLQKTKIILFDSLNHKALLSTAYKSLKKKKEKKKLKNRMNTTILLTRGCRKPVL